MVQNLWITQKLFKNFKYSRFDVFQIRGSVGGKGQGADADKNEENEAEGEF